MTCLIPPYQLLVTLTQATRTHTMPYSVPRREMREGNLGYAKECLPAQAAGSLGADRDGAPVKGVHPPHF